MRYENLIQASLFTPTPKDEDVMGLNLCLMGDVGIAKTSKVGQVARLFELYLQLVYGGRSGPQDLVVYLPKETDQGYVNSPCISGLVKGLDKNSILFLDEVTETRPDVLAIFQSMVLERELGGHKIPCPVILAGNPSAIATNGQKLSRPFCNRLTIVEVQPPSVAEYMDYLDGKEQKLETQCPEKERARVLAAWPSAYNAARVLQGNFLRAHQYDGIFASKMEGPWRPKSIEDLSFATPRSNETALHIIASSIVHGLRPIERDTLLKGTVGSRWLDMFVQYEATSGIIPNAEKWLENDGRGFEHNPARPDITLLLLSRAVQEAATQASPVAKEKYAGTILRTMGQVLESDPLSIDFILIIEKAMARAGIQTIATMREVDAEKYNAMRRKLDNAKGAA